jgi:murein DD-endopeptidase MepM/ murein hydrolase activator NlpD
VPIPAPTYAFPVQPIRHARFGHTHHDYPATDIFAPCGDSFVAPTSGTITEFRTVDTWVRRVNDGATRGGLSVTLVGDDGVRYYGSHLRSVSTLLTPGLHVDAGTLLGRVGDTGDAKGLGCHVHFGISSPQCGIDGDWWIRRGRLYPWPYLESWRGGGRRSPALTVQNLPLSVGCPAPPPGVRIPGAG